MVQCKILASLDPAEKPGRLFVFRKAGIPGMEHVIRQDAKTLAAVVCASKKKALDFLFLSFKFFPLNDKDFN